MKKLFLIILSLFIAHSYESQSQSPTLTRQFDFRTNDLTGAGLNIANRGISAHIFTWSVQSGVMTACTLSFETSPNGVTWTQQSTGDCTASGTSDYLIFVANWIRVRATTFTVQSGTALVTANYAGYIIAPTDIATITTAPLNNQVINNQVFAANFSGANAGIKINSALDYCQDNFIQGCVVWALFGGTTQTITNSIFASPNTISYGSRIIFGLETYNISGTTWDPPSSTTIELQGGTIFNASNASAYLISHNDTELNDIVLEGNGANIRIEGTALGFIKVGDPSTDEYDPNKSRWSLRNLYITGPGCTSACTLPSGTYSLSLTKYINWDISNVTFKGFYNSALFDRGGESIFDRVRFQSFVVGPKWSNKGGSGSISAGAANDTCESCAFQGPTSGSSGHTLTIDQPYVTCINCLYESQSGGTPVSLLNITNHGGYFHDIGGKFSAPSVAPTYTFKLDDGYDNPIFESSVIPTDNVNFTAPSIGTPTTGSVAVFKGVSRYMGTLVKAVTSAPNKVILTGPISTATDGGVPINTTISAVHDLEGVIRVLCRSGFSNHSPLTGTGLEIQCQDGTNQIILNAITRPATFRNFLFQGTGYTFENGGDVIVNRRVLEPVEITAANGDTTPSVLNGNYLNFSNSGATTVTAFDDAADGQLIVVVFANGNTTLAHNANLNLRGAVNHTYAATEVSLFRCFGSGSGCRELIRQ